MLFLELGNTEKSRDWEEKAFKIINFAGMSTGEALQQGGLMLFQCQLYSTRMNTLKVVKYAEVVFDLIDAHKQQCSLADLLRLCEVVRYLPYEISDRLKDRQRKVITLIISR